MGQAGRAAEHSLTIKDNLGRPWVSEPICWEMPATTADKVLVTRDGTPIAAQVVATAGGVHVLLLIDKLAKDAATTLSADFERQGPTQTDLSVATEPGSLVLANKNTAVRLNNGTGGNVSPILGIRTASGQWTGGGSYVTLTAKPVGSTTELLENGPVHLAARISTTFDNGRTHVVTVGLWSGSHSIDVDETFDTGPDAKYQFKQYADAKDELAWEWWTWYGDREGLEETHPNNWVLRLAGAGYRPNQITYYGQASTDAQRGRIATDAHSAGLSGYSLANDKARRFEKYLAGHTQWRPDSVLWYLTSASGEDAADALAVYTHSVRNWRNPNVLPTPKGITLRTGANDMRVISREGGTQLELECPIGLGRRCWSIRVSTRKEMLSPVATSPTALDAERVQRCMGLDITRHWITDWAMNNDYPRLFIKPEEKDAYYARLKGKGIDAAGTTLDFFLRRQDPANFERDYDSINQQADRMIAGYESHGMDSTAGYPGWMLGYWHAMIVAGGVDNLCGSPLCRPEQARALKKKLAVLTYALVSEDAWSDKQINYGWGSMNMPVARWGGRVVLASALSDHPLAKTWLDHTNADQLGFVWNEKGVPLTDFEGAMYQPMACTAVSHSTLAWDVLPGGAPAPGKDQPGNWYHEHHQPYVDLGGLTPRRHWQIGCDQNTQRITETRGLVTRATDSPAAAMLEGKVLVNALSEVPTRQDNYAIALAPQAEPPTTPLAHPFTWTRRLLYVKAAAAAGMNYLVVRDDTGGFDQRTPNFNAWWFADEVELAGQGARFSGQFGVDTDLYVAVPSQVQLHKDAFIHNQCEPIVAGLNAKKFRGGFTEKQVLCRAEGQKDQGFLVVLFPYKSDEARPLIENWQGDKGIKVTWKGETHYVILDTRQHTIDADGIQARASCLVVKVANATDFTLGLPDGGQAAFRGQSLQGEGPAEVVVEDGKARQSPCTDLMSER